jgi:uncharacterized protein DUF6221
VSDLVEFLKARLDEDERIAAEAERLVDRDAWFDILEQALGDGREAVKRAATTHYLEFRPLRILRDIEAKRRIMARHKPIGPGRLRRVRDELNCEGCGWEGELGDPVTENIDECPELRDLASAYADHKDYRAEWQA